MVVHIPFNCHFTDQQRRPCHWSRFIFPCSLILNLIKSWVTERNLNVINYTSSSSLHLRILWLNNLPCRSFLPQSHINKLDETSLREICRTKHKASERVHWTENKEIRCLDLLSPLSNLLYTRRVLLVQHLLKIFVLLGIARERKKYRCPTFFLPFLPFYESHGIVYGQNWICSTK